MSFALDELAGGFVASLRFVFLQLGTEANFRGWELAFFLTDSVFGSVL